MTFHLRRLSERQQQALRELGPVATQLGFYLAGGTAVALWLGHRRSVDFDWFREQPIADPLRLAWQFQEAGVPVSVTQTDLGTLHARLRRVRLSFFEYRYPLLEPPGECSEYGLRVASRADLACMKLAAVSQRGSKKDFIDIYFLARELSLPRMLELYRRKYGVEDIAHVVYSLTYFEDADRQRTPAMLCEARWRDVKAMFRSWIRELSDVG